MKKVGSVLLTLVFMFLSGCSCSHEWVEATCAAPKTCALCGETEGVALEHMWEDATYTQPKTCEKCGATEGEPDESPYKDCASWEEIFDKIFDDDFEVEPIEESGSDVNAIGLRFDKVDDASSFMFDAFSASFVVGNPEYNGVDIEERLDAVALIIENAALIAILPVDTTWGVATMLRVSDDSDLAAEIEAEYNKSFGMFDIS